MKKNKIIIKKIKWKIHSYTRNLLIKIAEKNELKPKYGKGIFEIILGKINKWSYPFYKKLWRYPEPLKHKNKKISNY